MFKRTSRNAAAFALSAMLAIATTTVVSLCTTANARVFTEDTVMSDVDTVEDELTNLAPEFEQTGLHLIDSIFDEPTVPEHTVIILPPKHDEPVAETAENTETEVPAETAENAEPEPQPVEEQPTVYVEESTASIEIPEPEPEPEPVYETTAYASGSVPTVYDQADLVISQTEVSDWAARIDRYMAGTPLAGYGYAFAQAACDYGVDPRLSPAIATVESSNGLYCFRSHNAWGWGSSSWPDWETAIYGHIAGLAAGGYMPFNQAAGTRYCNSGYWSYLQPVLNAVGNA